MLKKGIHRTLLIFKVLFLAKWMKPEDVLLIKQIFTGTNYILGFALMLVGGMKLQSKPSALVGRDFQLEKTKINNHLDKIYAMSDGHKFDRGNRKSREQGYGGSGYCKVLSWSY